MTLRVLKFGGSSVATPAAARAALARVEAARREARPLVVVSALGGATDVLVALVAAAEGSDPVWREGFRSLGDRHRRQLAALAGGPPAARAAVALDLVFADLERRLAGVERRGGIAPPGRAAILAAGERLSAPIFAAALAARGIPAEAIDATGLLVAVGPFEDAEPDLPGSAARARLRLAAAPVGALPVVPGFFGGDAGGGVRLFGRGGSDTSATALGAALDAGRVEIWTDVDGVCAEDPRRHAGARPFARLDYGAAERIARAGARVLHHKALAPARAAGVPILVRNTFHPEAPGTWIGDEAAVARAAGAGGGGRSRD